MILTVMTDAIRHEKTITLVITDKELVSAQLDKTDYAFLGSSPDAFSIADQLLIIETYARAIERTHKAEERAT